MMTAEPKVKMQNLLLILLLSILVSCSSGDPLKTSIGDVWFGDDLTVKERRLRQMDPSIMLNDLERERQIEITETIRKQEEKAQKLSPDDLQWKPWEKSEKGDYSKHSPLK